MARRLIGLDVGTNAVTVAEVSAGSTPRCSLFGQVALPRDAMREGEVVDEAAVSEAITRLRTEVGLKRAAVRVGIASPRVIVRQVEMPAMSRDDLASALHFQAPDLIPIPIDEAAIDFAVLGTDTPDSGESTMRVLLAAAQEATVRRLVAAVEAGGLSVAAVDLVPLALIRALASPNPLDGSGAEGIVSFGGGVTSIVVHEDRVPRFVRVLGTGGRELTDAIASELELPADTAESLKRQLASPGDQLLTRARAAIDRPLGALVEDVRGSLDYYRNQPGASPLVRVLCTGGGAQLPGLADRLASAVGVPVEIANPRQLLQIGDIGFGEADLPRLDPYLPAAVGLALGGANLGTVINLVSKARRGAAAPASRARMIAVGAGAAAAMVALLAVPTLAREHDVSHAKSEASAQQGRNDSLQRQITALASTREQQDTLERATAQVQNVLANDVSWSRLLTQMSQTIPNDVWLTAFNGSIAPATGASHVAASTTTTTSTPGNGDNTTASSTASSTSGTSGTSSASTLAGAPQGTVTFTANGLDYASLSSWLDRMAQMKSFADVFVPNASLQEGSTRAIVSFTSTALLTADAHTNDRAEHYLGAAR